MPSGSPSTSPSTRSLIAASVIGSRRRTCVRRLGPQSGRRSASSERANVRMKMGACADSTSVSKKSSSPSSAHCTSSTTSTQPPAARAPPPQPLQEQPPGGEQLVARVRRPRRCEVSPPEQRRQPRQQPRTLLRIDDVRRQRLGQPVEERLPGTPLPRTEPHPHHLGKRPERDPVAVRKAAPPVPRDDLGDAVAVLVEFPAQP